MTEDTSNDSHNDALPLAGREAGGFRARLEEAAPSIRRYLFGLCGNWLTSDDLSQETLLKAWQKRDGFDGRADVRTWVFIIARNLWISSLRRRSGKGHEELVFEHYATRAAGPEANASRRELEQAIAAALDSLPAEQREVLALRQNGGLTFSQTADVLGLPVGTVKTRARLALLKLARELEPFRQELLP